MSTRFNTSAPGDESADQVLARIARAPAASMIASLLNWGFSLIVGGLLVRVLAERRDLHYRAAAAAAYLGLGATWAMGLSSSAAQLQANPASLPKSLLTITGVIPFTETIFLWQSFVITAVLLVISVVIAVWSARGPDTAVTAETMGIDRCSSSRIGYMLRPPYRISSAAHGEVARPCRSGPITVSSVRNAIAKFAPNMRKNSKSCMKNQSSAKSSGRE